MARAGPDLSDACLWSNYDGPEAVEEVAASGSYAARVVPDLSNDCLWSNYDGPDAVEEAIALDLDQGAAAASSSLDGAWNGLGLDYTAAPADWPSTPPDWPTPPPSATSAAADYLASTFGHSGGGGYPSMAPMLGLPFLLQPAPGHGHHVQPMRPSSPPSSVGATVASDLPSAGSAMHDSQECRPCVYFIKNLCQLGSACGFCHMGHEKTKWKHSRAPKHVREKLRIYRNRAKDQRAQQRRAAANSQTPAAPAEPAAPAAPATPSASAAPAAVSADSGGAQAEQ